MLLLWRAYCHALEEATGERPMLGQRLGADAAKSVLASFRQKQYRTPGIDGEIGACAIVADKSPVCIWAAQGFETKSNSDQC